MKDDLTARLVEFRKSLGLSQRAMAEAVGCSKTSWEGYERGARPGFDVLAGLTRLGISVDWLITGEGQMRTAAAELERIDRELADLNGREGWILKQYADEPEEVLLQQVELPRQALMKRREEILAAARQEPAPIDLELLTSSIRDVESLVAALQDDATPAEKASLAAKWYRIQLKDRAEGKGAPAAGLIDLVRRAS